MPQILSMIFNFTGSLCVLLFGMKLLSDGIQKSADAGLQNMLGFMTKNRFLGLFTGFVLTMIIQSSGATTVMVVSFVNASLLTLEQSIAVIFGANIGTTVTAWIVALFGFNFKISSIAIPLFAAGYLLTVFKRFRKEGIGQAIMGFSLMFIALGWLSESLSLNAEKMSFLSTVQNLGMWSSPVAVVIGIIVTALIHSSSAMTAIVITMAYNGLLTWEFSAALVIGSNIGSTVDSVMASFGSKTNARRTALVHVLFNSATAFLALIFLPQLTSLVDFITPGRAQENVTYHIAMLHTLFNVMGTVLFLPFTNQVAWLTKAIIREKVEEVPATYSFLFPEHAGYESSAVFLMTVRKEIQRMADVTVDMFDCVQGGFSDGTDFVAHHYEKLEREEAYIDQMQEQLTAYLFRCQKLNLNDRQIAQVNAMLAVVTELESLSDDCLTIGVYIKRIEQKKIHIAKDDKELLFPYIELVRQLLYFVYRHIGSELSEEQLDFANSIENQIDDERSALKKLARNRLEQGKDVRSELLYIDIVSKVEKMGDSCFAIARQLRTTDDNSNFFS